MSKFNERIKLSEINNNFNNFDGKEVEVCGWIRNLRDSKKIAFIELNDGSHFKSTQVVLEEGVENYKDIVSLNIGSSIIVYGKVKVTPEAKQPFEIVAEKVATTEKYKYITIEDIENELRDGKQGVSGIGANGKMYRIIK